MPVWIRLGVIAFRRTFRCGKFGCEGGARDFAWLTLLMALVFSLALLLVGGRKGFLEGLGNALLGAIPPHGVPVWVTSHWENHEGIDMRIMAQLRALKGADGQATPGLGVHPYRRLGQGGPRIDLPDSAIWKSDPDFVGWGVYPDHPLWKMSQPPRRNELGESWLGLPLEVVLNANLFRRQFDVEAYRQAVEPMVRETGRGGWRGASTGEAFIREVNTLWLKVSVAQEERLLPFSVRWASNIPAMEAVAYLFPLQTYNALLAAYHLPDLKFDPLHSGDAVSPEGRQLAALGEKRGELVEYVRCIQAEVDATGLTGLQNIHSSRCRLPALAKAERRPEVGSPPKWDAVNHDRDNWLWLPCHRLPRTDPLRANLCSDWDPGAGKVPLMVPWDVTSFGVSFSAIHLFVQDPSRLMGVIEAIRGVRNADRRQALNIHPMYQDALNRFNMVSDVLSTLVPAYAISFALLLFFLLMAQIGTLVDHRRNHYGMLLSRGFTWGQIHLKLLFQMSLSLLVAGGLTLGGLLPLFRFSLAEGFREVVARYEGMLAPDHGLDLLPLSPLTIGITFGGLLAMVVLMSFILAFRLPLTWRTTPSDLLHGDSQGHPPPKKIR
ncbi:MAG: hypothetical protein HQL56_02960 [Magnetococcales bacterium]|nr:hypothetical protein [Magnetococcales bacterium]